MFGTLDYKPFGNLQLQPLGSQVIFLQNPEYHFYKTRLPELTGGDVDRHPHRGQSLLSPEHDLPAGLVEDPFTYRNDQPRIFGQGNKFEGTDSASFRMLPAQQAFEAFHLPCA